MRTARTPTPTPWTVALLAALLAAPAAGQTPPESPAALDVPAAPAAAGPPARSAEPTPSTGAEQAAVLAAQGGEPFEDPAVSGSLAGALERLKAQAAPPDEVFALFKVTDRATGETRVFVRGTPDPRLGEWLEDPAGAPDGRLYGEVDSAWTEGGVEIAVRAVHVRPNDGAPVVRGEREAEEERELLERNAGGILHPRIDGDLRRMLLAGEIDPAAPGSAPVPVVITLRGVPPMRLPKTADPAHGGLLWAGLDVQIERERRIIERKQAMAALQRPLVEALERLGGRVTYGSWTSGSIQAHLPPAVLEAVAAHPAVFSLDFLPPHVTHGHRYQGDDIYVAMNAQDYDPWHAGAHGLSSKHSYTGRVVLAMSEECVNWTSPAWRTGAPGSASRGKFYDIDPDDGYTLGGLEDCVNSTDHSTTGHAAHKHGHWVLGNMAGDFMDGQEPSLGTTASRRLRSGTCEECFFLFGQDWSLDERTRAYDWACDKGADIFQSSVGGGTSCDGNGSLDSDIESLVNCDVVYVQSAANNGSTGGCSTGYPADHPWTFAVGGIKTEDPCDTAGEYFTSTCPYDPNASRGGADYDGCDGCADIVDLAGPYRVAHGLDPNTANPTQVSSLQGTSFASPIVAGLMARMMDWYRQHVSTSIFYNNRARNFMMLMGDRSANADGSGQWANTTDPRWGAGRVRLEPFDSLNCWVVHRGSVSLPRGASYTVDLGAGDCVQFFKAVVWHTGKDYSNEPMIRLTLDPLGCSTPTSSVDRLDAKSLLRISLSDCSAVRMTIKNVGVGFSGTRTFHFASYGDGTNSDRGF